MYPADIQPFLLRLSRPM